MEHHLQVGVSACRPDDLTYPTDHADERAAEAKFLTALPRHEPGWLLVTGNGPSLLLLHGLLGTADAWGPATQRLAASSTVYAPDALGIGGSDRVPKLDVSLSATAGRLIELMDAKGIDQADIVGTSHGGSVALILAALYPERVRSLVLHAHANPSSALADPLIRLYRTALRS